MKKYEKALSITQLIILVPFLMLVLLADEVPGGSLVEQIIVAPVFVGFLLFLIRASTVFLTKPKKKLWQLLLVVNMALLLYLLYTLFPGHVNVLVVLLLLAVMLICKRFHFDEDSWWSSMAYAYASFLLTPYLLLAWYLGTDYTARAEDFTMAGLVLLYYGWYALSLLMKVVPRK